MLTVILGVTLIGFALLVVALVTSQFALAVACIVVCVVGLVLLLIDAVRASRRSKGGADDDPLFTIRGRESAVRAEPLLDDEDPRTASSDDGLGELVVDEPLTAAAEATAEDLAAEQEPDAGQDNASGAVPDGPAEGDAGDYIRSVTGSFPVQRPTGAAPAARPSGTGAEQVAPQPAPPNTGPQPTAGPPSAPWPAAQPPYPQPPQAAAPQPPQASPQRPASGPTSGSDGPGTGPIPATSPYVGRRRRAERTEPPATRPATAPPAGPGDEGSVDDLESAETMILHDQTGPLPKITFVDPDAAADGDSQR